MSTRVQVKPKLLLWACNRNGREPDAYLDRFPAIGAWVSGEAVPTLKQLESFAKATHTPIGYLFLPTPPEERVPLPDFRTIAGGRTRHPSPDLLETIYVCQQRQEWYRDFARSTGERPLHFVGSAQTRDEVVPIAATIRETLGFALEAQTSLSTWTDALRHFIERADTSGIMVMCSGVVKNNNRRHLDPEEFRGFAMVDALAPVVFINGADSKAAQMFTLAHELAHVWLGQSGVSDAEASEISTNEVERWCNEVAAELLVPLAAMRREYLPDNELGEEMLRLARRFKVSTLVVLRRIHDVGGLSWEELWAEYAKEVARLRSLPRSSGGNFYLSLAARVSKRFARALVVSTLEGHTRYNDAFRMLGFSKHATFTQLGTTLGIA